MKQNTVKFLLACVFPAMIGAVYLLFETKLLSMMGASPENSQAKKFLLALCLVSAFVLFGTTFLLKILWSKIQTLQASLSKTKDIPELILKFGAYWDNNAELYCVSCKKPLTFIDDPRYFEPIPYCANDKSSNILVDSNGQYLPVYKAKNLFKQNFNK